MTTECDHDQVVCSQAVQRSVNRQLHQHEEECDAAFDIVDNGG